MTMPRCTITIRVDPMNISRQFTIKGPRDAGMKLDVLKQALRSTILEYCKQSGAAPCTIVERITTFLKKHTESVKDKSELIKQDGAFAKGGGG